MNESLDPEKTALIIVDMLNDFVEPEGALVVPAAASLVRPQAKVLRAAREAGMLVLFLADNHMPDDPEFKIWPRHAVAGTWGAAVVDGLAPSGNEKVVPKRRYSGFFGTDLDLTLREHGIRDVVLMGVLTDICVMYTSADASARGYRVLVLSDCTASLDTSRHEWALEHMRQVHDARTVPARELLSVLRQA